MQSRESSATFARNKIAKVIIALSLAFGLSASPGWMEGIEREWQVRMIDRQTTSEGVQEAIDIIRRKFALLPLVEIDARLGGLSTESPPKNIVLSNVIQRLEDRYSRVASHLELSSLFKFDPSGTGVVIRQGPDGGIYLSHAGRRDDVRDMRVLSIAGQVVSTLYEAAELLIQHEKPLEITLQGSADGIKEGDRTSIMVDVDDEYKRLTDQGTGSVQATMLKQGSHTIGYIRIKQFDAFVGNEVPAPHSAHESGRTRHACCAGRTRRMG